MLIVVVTIVECIRAFRDEWSWRKLDIYIKCKFEFSETWFVCCKLSSFVMSLCVPVTCSQITNRIWYVKLFQIRRQWIFHVSIQIFQVQKITENSGKYGIWFTPLDLHALIAWVKIKRTVFEKKTTKHQIRCRSMNEIIGDNGKWFHPSFIQNSHGNNLLYVVCTYISIF